MAGCTSYSAILPGAVSNLFLPNLNFKATTKKNTPRAEHKSILSHCKISKAHAILKSTNILENEHSIYKKLIQ